RLLRIQSVAQRGSHPLFESTTPASSLVNPMPASLLRPGIGTKPRTCPLPDVADHVVQAEGSSRKFSAFARSLMLPTSVAVRMSITPRVLKHLRPPASHILPLNFSRQASTTLLANGFSLIKV